MLTKKQNREAQEKTALFLRKHNIAVTPEEEKRIEIIDHGFGYNQLIMVQILVYENNDIYCAKELAMFPGQIVPEHRHPPVGKYPGKMETFRCRAGEIYLYVPGKAKKNPKAKLPADRKNYFTSWHEIILKPGGQYTLPPNTWHWFQAGTEGYCI